MARLALLSWHLEEIAMRRTLIAVGLACMATGTAWGYASSMDGNGLQRLCSSNSAGDKQACLAYITGAFDMMSSLGNLSDKICLAGDVQLGQLKGVVEVWLHEHPEKWHWTAAYIVEKAFREKFPCK
jgi:hypothetical protein